MMLPPHFILNEIIYSFGSFLLHDLYDGLVKSSDLIEQLGNIFLQKCNCGTIIGFCSVIH